MDDRLEQLDITLLRMWLQKELPRTIFADHVEEVFGQVVAHQLREEDCLYLPLSLVVYSAWMKVSISIAELPSQHYAYLTRPGCPYRCKLIPAYLLSLQDIRDFLQETQS